MRMKKLLAFVLAMEVLFAVPVRGEEAEKQDTLLSEIEQESGLPQEAEDIFVHEDEAERESETPPADEGGNQPQTGDASVSEGKPEWIAEADPGTETEIPWESADTSANEAEMQPDAVILIFETVENGESDQWEDPMPEAEAESNPTDPVFPDEPEDSETLDISDETDNAYLGGEGADGYPMLPSDTEPDIPDPADERDDPDNAPLTAASAEEDVSNDASPGQAVSLSDVELTPVATNDQYSQLTFSFSADGREYT